MPLDVIVGSTTKAAVRASAYPSTTAKRATRIEAWNGSAWKLVQSFAPPMVASITPDPVNGFRDFAGIIVIESSTATCTPTGGTGPYTYSWAQTSGPAATIVRPNFAATSFRMALGPGDAEQANFTVTVTDSTGLTAQATVTAYFNNTSGA